MLISLHEIFDMVLMSLVLGFLFKDIFKPAKKPEDIINFSTKAKSNFWFAVAVTAPSVILHEMAHKFVAIGFGLSATFHAFYASSTTLMLGIIAIIAKLSGFGFVFLVPGFVQIFGSPTPMQRALIAFSGPAIHALFYGGSILYTKLKKKMSFREAQFIHMTKYINGFLFILNMLPIPGIDGFAVYQAIIDMF